MNYQRPDMYYDNPPSHSPNPQRHHHQALHRQPSRQFDAFGNNSAAFYPTEDHSARFDVPRFNDRMTAATMHGNYGGYDMGAQTWNSAAFGNNTLGGLGNNNRMKPSTRGRTGLPSGWLEQPQPLQNVPSFMGLGGNSVMGASPVRTDPLGSEPDDDLIPTAIVIKNIPFAVKKEHLVSLMTDLGLPLPYAFNYHFDNGVFRGLAFANFTSADETAAVIDILNHYDLQGRKLRVEYKKMLPAAERERIEREKRERRGQLEEQHRPMGGPTLQTQPSLSSMSSIIPATSPSPVSARNVKPDVDLNDPEVLQYYTKLVLFKEDKSKDVLVLPPNLTPPQRRIVHTLAHHMGLAHMSKGSGEQRAVHVYKEQPRQRLSPPVPQIQALQGDNRRALNRAATTDFSDVRNGDNFYGVRHQTSSYLPAFQDSPMNLTAGQNLRAAKSFADLRSYTPSPVPSTASFPASLTGNISRYQENGSGASTTPTLTTSATSQSTRDEGLLVNGLGNMNLGNGFGNSPRGVRGMMSWERGNGDNPGTIGGHRAFSTNNFDEQSRDRNPGFPSRQPRGPATERGPGFSRNRQNGHMNRGSDELSQQSSGVEISVE